jgi:hypothetical protein
VQNSSSRGFSFTVEFVSTNKLVDRGPQGSQLALPFSATADHHDGATKQGERASAHGGINLGNNAGEGSVGGDYRNSE